MRTSSHAAASPVPGFCHHVSHLHCLLFQLPANALGHVLQHPDAARDQLQLLILLLHNQLGPKRREMGNYRSAACSSWLGDSPSSGQALAAQPTSAVRPGLRPKPPGMMTAFLRNVREETTRGKSPWHGIPMAQQAAASRHPCKSSLSLSMLHAQLKRLWKAPRAGHQNLGKVSRPGRHTDAWETPPGMWCS